MRIDRFSGDDQPLLNSNFAGRYGFNNRTRSTAATCSCRASASTGSGARRRPIYGGWGLFGGGSPNVWISNSFSNDGVTVVQPDHQLQLAGGIAAAGCTRSRTGSISTQAVLDNHTLLRGDGQVNAVDPNFNIPSQYRWNLGHQADAALGHPVDGGHHPLAGQGRSAVEGPAPAADRHGAGRPARYYRAPTCRPATRADTALQPAVGQDLLLTNTHEGRARSSRPTSRRPGARAPAASMPTSATATRTSRTSIRARVRRRPRTGTTSPVATSTTRAFETSNYEIEHRSTAFQLAQGLLRRQRDERRARRRTPLRQAVQLHLRRRHAAGRLGRPAPGGAPARPVLCAGSATCRDLTKRCARRPTLRRPGAGLR